MTRVSFDINKNDNVTKIAMYDIIVDNDSIRSIAVRMELVREGDHWTVLRMLEHRSPLTLDN